MGDAELHTWLTVAALVRRLGRPPATIRLWRDTYAEFVPEQINEDGHQTYPLEILEQIAAMRDEKLTPREIKAELARRQDREPAQQATLGEVLAELRAIRAVVERIAESLADRP